MHKTSIHDPQQEIQTQISQNRRIKSRTKIPQKDSKKTQKTLELRDSLQNHEENQAYIAGKLGSIPDG
jgi:hypothetical protein